MNPIKKLARRALEGLGYDIYKRSPDADGTLSDVVKVKGVEVFPLAMRDLIHRRKGDVFFLQIGAHDGLTYDPMRPFVDEYDLAGLLVEPQPKVFARLVENYRGATNLRFENAAVAREDGEVVLYTFAESPDLPEHATQLASFRREALTGNTHGYAGEIVENRVPAISLPTLLKKHNVKHVDVLQLDTEGFDFDIIKMIDFDKMKPSIINYENAYLNPPEQNQCLRLLAAQGYRIHTYHVDTTAVLQDDYRAALSGGLTARKDDEAEIGCQTWTAQGARQ